MSAWFLGSCSRTAGMLRVLRLVRGVRGACEVVWDYRGLAGY